MVNKELFSKRLNELLKYYEISASSFADSIGVQRSSISHLLSGRNNPSLDFVLKVLDEYPEISFNWFVKGVGKIDQPQNKHDATPNLFNQDISKNAVDEKKIKLSSNMPDIRSSREVEKIILLYKDGSFSVYDE
jgi:transcriptional regulator with XRE-family HTH domain